MKSESNMDAENLCQPTNTSAKPVQVTSKHARKCLTRPSSSAPRAADTSTASSVEARARSPKDRHTRTPKCLHPAPRAVLVVAAERALPACSARIRPHFVHGFSGNRFPTPFAYRPGKGLSSPAVNVLWFSSRGSQRSPFCSAPGSPRSIRVREVAPIALFFELLEMPVSGARARRPSARPSMCRHLLQKRKRRDYRLRMHLLPLALPHLLPPLSETIRR
jgi:hypothetical protein